MVFNKKRFTWNENFKMGEFITTQARPNNYPFNLDPTGHGAPRFKNGRLVTQRNWKILSPYESQFSSFQRQEIEKAQEMMGEMVKRREISANRRKEKQALFHPWGIGHGNPSYSGQNMKSKFIKNLNGSPIQQRMPLRSDLGGGGEPIVTESGELDARRKGPFVNVEPSGVKVTDLTHHPLPSDGKRLNPHKIRDRPSNFLSQPTMSDWMKRLPTGQFNPKTIDEKPAKIMKTDVTHPRIAKSYPTILPLRILPQIPLPVRYSAKVQVRKFNESSS